MQYHRIFFYLPKLLWLVKGQKTYLLSPSEQVIYHLRNRSFIAAFFSKLWSSVGVLLKWCLHPLPFCCTNKIKQFVRLVELIGLSLSSQSEFFKEFFYSYIIYSLILWKPVNCRVQLFMAFVNRQLAFVVTAGV